MALKFSNRMQSALRQSALAADTTLYIDADDVDDLPTLGSSDKAKLVLFDGETYEVVNITAWDTDGTLTVERAQEGTAARDWGSGTICRHTLTAEAIQNVVNATSEVVFFGTITNVSNAYTVTLPTGDAVPNLTNGETVQGVASASNSGAATLVVTNGVTSTALKSIVTASNVALSASDIVTGTLIEVIFSETFDAWVLSGNASLSQDVDTVNDGPLAGVSRHPNGRFDFWANGSSFSTPASLTETADGWVVVYDGTIGAFTIARQAFTLGQTTVPWNPKYYLRWDQSSAGSGSTIRRLRVKLPGVHWRQGEEVTRGIYLKADASRNVTAKLIQHFGTGGSPSSDVEADSDVLALTTSWQRFEITTTLPSIAGKTLGSGGDDGLYLTLDLPVNVTMTIDVAMDDLRSGAIAGRQDDLFPLPTWKGGLGGSYESTTDFLSTAFPDLAAIEALSSTGFPARTASNTWAQRSLAAPAAGFTITNPAGVAGNPTFVLADDLAALEALSGTNTIYYRSGASTWSAVTIGGLLSFSGGTLNITDAELAALAGLTSAADQVPYFTGSGTASLAASTSFGRSVLNAANNAALATLAGVGTANSPSFAGLTLTGNLNLPSGGVINLNSSDVLITHSPNMLSFTGANSGYIFDRRIEVNTSGSSVAGSNSDELVLRNEAGNGGLTIFSANTGLGSIHFGDTDNSGPGRIIYDHSVDSMAFYTGSGSRATLVSSAFTPTTNDGIALGTTSLSFADLCLASGGTINWANGNMVLTQSSALLTLTGGVFAATQGAAASTATGRFTNTTDNSNVAALIVEGDRATPSTSDIVYMSFYLSNGSGTQTEFGRIGVTPAGSITAGNENSQLVFYAMTGGSLAGEMYMTSATLRPFTNDGLALGDTGRSWSDLFGASGFTLNIANGNWVATHSSGILTISTGDLRVTTAGTNAASVVTVGGTQTLTNKSLTSPAINGGTIDDVTSLEARLAISSETSGTLTAASRNRIVYATGNIQIDSGVFEAGDTIVYYTGGSSRTITQGAGVTMRLDATTTAGSRSAGGRAMIIIHFISASECVVCGKGAS